MNLYLDVGGTNVRLENCTGARAIYGWDEIASINQAIERLSHEHDGQGAYDHLVLAMAGLVIPGQSEFTFTNVGQTFSRRQLAPFAKHVHIINDFAAQAALIPELTQEDLSIVKPGDRKDGPRAVVGPGTGLGIAGIGSDGQLFPGEGGHVALPYLSHAPASLWQSSMKALRLEDVLSGQGLVRLYTCLTHSGETPTASQISALAHEGNEVAKSVFDLFYDFLAVACANQALQYGTSGGVYLVGDIISANQKLLDQARFAAAFSNHPSHRSFLKQVPVIQVNRSLSGLAGARAYLRRAKSNESVSQGAAPLSD